MMDSIVQVGCLVYPMCNLYLGLLDQAEEVGSSSTPLNWLGQHLLFRVELKCQHDFPLQ